MIGPRRLLVRVGSWLGDVLSSGVQEHPDDELFWRLRVLNATGCTLIGFGLLWTISFVTHGEAFIAMVIFALVAFLIGSMLYLRWTHRESLVAHAMVATLFTALVQSSSATMGVVIAMALQGLITLEAGIALALGANIGTCATAGLAALGKPREAVRVAVAHVSFKIVGVLLIVPFIPYLAELVRDSVNKYVNTK